MKIRVATRKSSLSIKQVELVLEALKRFQEIEPELVFVNTKGDLHAELPPMKIGSKGIFEKEVNLAVMEGRADMAIHSMKDVPTKVSEGLVLAAVLPRESYREVLLSKDGLRLDELPSGAIIGTSSVRRRAAIRCLRPDLRIEHLRGNVDTRVRKFKEKLYDAIVVAEAGLRRLGLEGFITQVFTLDEITPAPCQGVIGIYAKKDDREILDLLSRVDDQKTRLEVEVEREIVKRVGGGCFVPLGVLSEVVGDKMTITASLYSLSGRGRITVKRSCSIAEHSRVVMEVSERLLKEGEHVLSEARATLR